MKVFTSWFIYRWRQILASLAIVGALINTGCVVGWSIEASKIVNDPNLKFNLTSDYIGLLVSVGSITSIPATLSTGFLAEIIGPCRLLTIILVPSAIAWIVMSVAESFAWLIAGRVVTGGIAFMLTTLAQPLVAELCQADVRGALSTLPEVAISVGVLLVYIFARFLTWEVTTLICGILTFPAIACMYFVPESPYWYLKQGEGKLAKRSLVRVRAPEHDVDGELASMAEGMNSQTIPLKKQIAALCEPANCRPVLLLCVLFFLRELGGSIVIFMYAVFFFENAGVTIDPFTCSILIGVARLVFTILSCCLIDRLGRRALFIGSSIVCSISMFITGIVLRYPSPAIQWVPLVAVIVFVASFGFGSGPVPWILIGEMLPTPVRSIGASFATCVFTTVLYVLTQTFPSFIEYAGLDDAVFMFAFFHLFAAVVSWLFLPETRNKTLEELQTAFVGTTLRPFREAREGYMAAYGATYSDKVY